YSTINDICHGKTNLKNCSGETLYKISRVLDITMEILIEDSMRCDFELFKSNVCHKLKCLGDINFIISILENNEINEYYQKKWYPECLYLLAMVDYLSRIHDIPLCNEFDHIRQQKLDKPLYPKGIIIKAKLYDDDSIMVKAFNESILEFRNFNIVESDIRNVI
ncbi:MAG: hypothetical protein LUG46_07590, partial [Erysipelotrichaceae bacterium]|nr:hypothetical protein [Erysipelotrichaceae bacterium]